MLIKVSANIPPRDWMKLNKDGASQGNPGKAGGGGVIRDSTGKWVKGFSRSMGVTTSVIAEFWAIRDGLVLAKQLGIQNLEVELDAKIVADLLQADSVTNRFSSSPLLNDCRLLLNSFHQIRMRHVFREANFCADSLARRGLSQAEYFVVFDFPPS